MNGRRKTTEGAAIVLFAIGVAALDAWSYTPGVCVMCQVPDVEPPAAASKPRRDTEFQASVMDRAPLHAEEAATETIEIAPRSR